jgi:Arc/MetJ-type ribon-helix-helix transcriptional regulator
VKILVDPRKRKDTVLVNFKLNRNVVKILDQIVESGLYKTRVDIVLSALRIYKPFKEMWKKEVADAIKS